MKKENVLLFIVILLTMVNLVSAQKVKWTANVQDTRDTSRIFFGPKEWGGWLTSASVQPGLVSYPGCDATCVVLHNKIGAQCSYTENLTLMTLSNRITHYYTNGPLTPAAFTASGAWSKFLGSLDTVTIDFQGHTIWATCTDKDLTAGTAGCGWIEHKNMGRATCIISRHGNDKNFIHGLAVCGQVVDSTTSKMLLTGEAIIVKYGPVGPGPGSGGGGSNGNYAGLTFEQLLQLAEKMRPTNLVIAGNNNGNNNGVSGGTGTTSGGDGTSPGVVKPTPAPGFDPVWEPLDPQPNNTRTTTTTSTTNTTNTNPGGGGGTACGNCGYAETKEDWALIERELGAQTKLQAQNNRYAKRTANATTAIAVASYVMPIAQPFIAWGVNELRERVDPSVAPATYNFFNNPTTGNTTVDANGNPVDWSNGSGGQAACILSGGTWDGTQCNY